MIISPLTITFLILKVSGIPLLEKRDVDDAAFQIHPATKHFLTLPRRKEWIDVMWHDLRMYLILLLDYFSSTISFWEKSWSDCRNRSSTPDRQAKTSPLALGRLSGVSVSSRWALSSCPAIVKPAWSSLFLGLPSSRWSLQVS